MNFLQAIFLGILQGLTEFLPISSSGHLVFFQKIFSFPAPPIMFDILVHLGTLIAIIIFFWPDVTKIYKGLKMEIQTNKKGNYKKLFTSLIIGTIPIVIWGILLKTRIGLVFDSLLFTGISFIFTSLILFMTVLAKEPKKKLSSMSFLDAVVIGVFQAFSILPGISRSGSTISSGLFQGLKREDAFKLSFFLGMIAVFGANILYVPEFFNSNVNEIFYGILGLISAAIFGFFSLRWLKGLLIKNKLYYFGIYCTILGFISILLA